MQGNFQAEASLADHWGGILALFLLFGFFFCSFLGYARLVRPANSKHGTLLDRVSDLFLFASLLLFASAFLFSSLHLLRALPRWAWWAILAPGLLAFCPLAAELAKAGWGKHRAGLCVALVVFGVRALGASLPAQHGDPLLYHLLGPRLWVEGGGFLMHPHLPNALLASSWECLYVWPQLLFFSPSSFFGLVEAQVVSQWLHLFLAWAGCALLAMRLVRGSLDDRWLPLTGLAALFVGGVQWTAPLAKNDVGIAFWVLGAVVFFREALRERSRAKFLWSGLFAGLALCGKITAVLSLAPLLGVLLLPELWKQRKQPRFLVVISASWLFGFALGAVPVYVRNFLLSGNPFFPLFPTLFPSPWMSRSWQAHFAQVHPSSPLHSLSRIFSRAPELWKESPWIVPAVIALVLAVILRKKAAAFFGERGVELWLPLLLGATGSYVIFVITQAPEIELRYLGASLLVFAAGGVAIALRLSEKLPWPIARKGAPFVLLVVLLATSRLPLHIVRKIWIGPLGVAFTRTHTAGEAKAWVREHSEGRLTILAGDNETYYLTPVPVAVLTERPDFDVANELTQLNPFVRKLCELSHARFLLDARPGIGLEAKFGLEKIKSALAYSAQGANVYDLRKLERAVGPAPYHCQ